MNKEPYQHLTDQQLLEQFYADRNNDWLGVLLQRYTMLLLGVCMKYLKNDEESRDAVQQIFLKAITELHKYRVDYFKSWLYMVAKNHCLMKLRNGKGRLSVELKDQQLWVQEEETVMAIHIEKNRQLELMALCLEELNKEQQQCVTLFYLEKQTYQEIATRTGYTLMQVKSHIQNGKRNLKILMEKKLASGQ